MSRHLTSDVELAESWGLSPAKFHELRRKHNWPHVRLGRFEFRFTDEQIAEIVATSTVKPKRSAAGESGLTERSARRAS